MSSQEPVKIISHSDLARLSSTLKGMPIEFRRRMTKAIARAVRPIKEEAKSNTDRLPQTGGLAERVAGASYRTSNKTRGKLIGVTLSTKNKEGYNLAAINAGRVRHRAWGRKDAWYDQDLDKGYFTEAVESHKDNAAREILAEGGRILSEIERSD